jgi:hypothetical protein
MRSIHVFSCAALILTAVNGAAAGEIALTEVEGKVLVNQGNNYVPGWTGLKLKPGARIFAVGKKSSAVVVHADNCTTRVAANAVFVVGKASPCQGGLSTVLKLEPGPIGLKPVALTGSEWVETSPAAAAAAPGGFGALLSGLPTAAAAGVIGGTALIVAGAGVGIGFAADSGGGGGPQIPFIPPQFITVE